MALAKLILAVSGRGTRPASPLAVETATGEGKMGRQTMRMAFALVWLLLAACGGKDVLIFCPPDAGRDCKGGVQVDAGAPR